LQHRSIAASPLQQIVQYLLPISAAGISSTACHITSLRIALLFAQVADNGRGIAPQDYEALALKYHTSKLAQFDDLEVRT
jgi:hypothetical protein